MIGVILFIWCVIGVLSFMAGVSMMCWDVANDCKYSADYAPYTKIVSILYFGWFFMLIIPLLIKLFYSLYICTIGGM